jgi:hypothetical protein
MTKPRQAVIVAAGTLLALAFALPAGAQPGPRRSPLGLYINAGYMNLNSAPKWATLGPEVEFRLGKALSLSGELSFWFSGFYGDTVEVVPGGSVNFRLRHFFFSGGVVRRIYDWEDQASGPVVPRFQAGFAPGPFKFTIIFLILNSSGYYSLGVNFGFRI